MIKTWQERVALSNGQWPDDECMKAEIDELREAFANLHSDYDMIEIDRDELRAELAVWIRRADKTWYEKVYTDEIATLKAKLAALESQEPVAEVLLVDGEKVIDASMAFFDSVELGTKLYLAAGAAPIQLTDDQLDEIADRCTPNTETGSLNYKMFAREVLAAAGAAPIQHVFGGRVDPNYVSGPMVEDQKKP